jgi:hypothetical protein
MKFKTTITFLKCFFVCNAFFDEIFLKNTVRHFSQQFLKKLLDNITSTLSISTKRGKKFKNGGKILLQYNAQCRQEKRSQTTTGLTSA